MEDARVGDAKDEYLKCKIEAQEMICSCISLHNAKILRMIKENENGNRLILKNLMRKDERRRGNEMIKVVNE